jgi:para-nitrobenzyl esterase
MRAHPDPQRFGLSVVSSSMAFIPVFDGETIATRPIAAVAAGAGAEIPLLIGTTTEEFRVFLVPTGVADAISAEALPVALAKQGIDPALALTYSASRPDASPGDVLAAILTDRFFRMPALGVAAARTGSAAPTYLYEFAWATPYRNLGACHALEVGFVFDTLAVATGGDRLAGPNPPQALADRMHAAWVSFASTGDPGWAAVDGSWPVMIFDEPADRLVLDPRGDERMLWLSDVVPSRG